MKRIALGSVVVAVCVGAFYWWVLGQFWAGYAASSPADAWFKVGIPYALTNILLAVPFAALLLLFPSQRRWLSLGTAVLGALAVRLWGLQLDVLADLVLIWQWWFSIGMCVIPLPIAYLALRGAQRGWVYVQDKGA